MQLILIMHNCIFLVYVKYTASDHTSEYLAQHLTVGMCKSHMDFTAPCADCPALQ